MTSQVRSDLVSGNRARLPDSANGVVTDLGPIPQVLVDKANALYAYLMHADAPLGENLQMVYRYVDEFRTYLAPMMSCRNGCSHCCRIDVQITTIEAEYIYLHTQIPLSQAVTLTEGHRDPCLFLTGGASCGIYPVRPLMCRLYHATGAPENCQPGRVQHQYGHAPTFSNPIFANLVKWTHHVVLNVGGTVADIRDFFPQRGATA